MQVQSDRHSTTLRFIASADVAVQAYAIDQPARIILEWPDVNFQLSPENLPNSVGVIKSLRAGMVSDDRARVVIELSEPALPSEIRTEPAYSGAATEIIVELVPSASSQFEEAVERRRQQAVRTDQSIEQVPTGDPKDRRPLIVIDPGHGGPDLGATGVTGIFEKDIVLAFSASLARKLRDIGEFRVAMTRERDVFVPLSERVNFARARGANLFLSIHADTLSGNSEVRGLTVYTDSDRPSDPESARLAEAENRSDIAAGLGDTGAVEAVTDILGDLMRRETHDSSSLFARKIVGHMTNAAKLNKNPVRSAGFRVLRAPDIPSVLLELGYISSPSDSELLTSVGWTERATDRLVAAIMDFFEARRNAAGSAAVEP
ncbi:MAG: N-acetylmuramoyl-L-alanine amidase [Hyphomicrobiales bacterium]